MKSDDEINEFKLQLNFLHYIGVWTKSPSAGGFPRLYSKIFICIFIFFYDALLTLNFFFMPRILHNYIDEMVFYFTELAVMSKVLTFYFMHDKLMKIFSTLQSYLFQPCNKEEIKIIQRARTFNSRYWKIVTVVSLTSNLVHIIPPVILHFIGFADLKLLICSYSFLSDDVKETYIFPLYFYQILGMHFHMWYNVNIDTLFLGLLVDTIAWLEILEGKLRKMTDGLTLSNNIDDELVLKFNKSIIHFGELAKFCSLIQHVFSITLFVQFSMASCIICICLFRFTMPAPWQYYIFLATYMFIMIIQILVPCWFGTRMMEKSFLLSKAIYDCDWVSRSSRFKSSMRIFVVRMNRPLAIYAWKMFPLSLTTFTSIINTAYSFFTLLRHMQSRD